MREILFRGKRVDNGEWILGDLSQFPQHNVVAISEQEPYYSSCAVYGDSLGQFTGMTDKYGIYIFEGDILRLAPEYDDPGEETFVTVEWIDGAWCVRQTDRPNFPDLFVPDDAGKFEIVGNIHDNPEYIG